MEVENLCLEDLKDIEIASEDSEEDLPENHVVQVPEDEDTCNDIIHVVMEAPNFKKAHSEWKKEYTYTCLYPRPYFHNPD